MTDSEKERLKEEAQNLRFTVKHMRLDLLPRLSRFKDEFKTSEWLVIEAAMDNYIADISQKATRLEIIAQQPF